MSQLGDVRDALSGERPAAANKQEQRATRVLGRSDAGRPVPLRQAAGVTADAVNAVVRQLGQIQYRVPTAVYSRTFPVQQQASQYSSRMRCGPRVIAMRCPYYGRLSRGIRKFG